MAKKRKSRLIIQLDAELDGLIRDVAALRGQSISRVCAELLQPYRSELRETIERMAAFKKKRRRRATR